MTEGLLGLLVMMVLCCLRVPISFAMAIVGLVGYAYMRDWNWAVAFASPQAGWLVGTEGRILKLAF